MNKLLSLTAVGLLSVSAIAFAAQAGKLITPDLWVAAM